MRLHLARVFVDDQQRALGFYTEVLGFQKQADIPIGELSDTRTRSEPKSSTPTLPCGGERATARGRCLPAERVESHVLQERGFMERRVSIQPLVESDPSAAMNTCRVLALSLLAASCAATAGPAPTAHAEPSTTSMSSPSVAQSVELEPDWVKDPLHGVAFSLLPPAPPKSAPAVNLAQDQTGGAPATKSPHSFSGGIGVRFRDGESALNLLVQYQYYVNPKLDIGAVGDWTMSPINTFLIAPAAWWHPTKRLTLFGAPGVEFASGKGGKAALRLGGSYALVLGKLVVRPFGWYDFVADRQDSFTFGIGFGM